MVAAVPCVLLVPPPSGPGTPSRWFLLALLMVLSSGAAYLAVGGGRDRRAGLLAFCLLLSASAFADGFLTHAADVAPALGPLRALAALQSAAFLPYASWAFFGDFPHATLFGAVAHLPARMRRFSAAIGAICFMANVALLVTPPPRGLWGAVLTPLLHKSPDSVFWPVVLALTAAALGYGIWNARHARVEERRRVWLLTAGVVLGSTPIVVLQLLTQLWPLAYRVITQPPLYIVAQWIVYCSLLAVPLVTAYAVHVHRALDVRLYVRRAVQYALARGTVLVVAAAPFVALAVLVYQSRDRRVAELLAGGRGAGLLAAGAAGLVVAGGRRRVLDAVDRRFFREQYDARVSLRDLVDGIRRVGDLGDLERLVAREIDRAFHPESVALLVLNARGEHLVSRDGGARPLSIGAAVAALVRERGEPVSVELDEPAGLGGLPEDDRAWLADGGFHLLVPLLDGAGSLIGLLALGAKRSELPFTAEDRALLAAVGSAIAVALERRLLAVERPSDRFAAPAVECRRCGLICSTENPVCARCGGAVGPATVPLLVAGKFMVEERINLAAIYGLESWKGAPLLVVEYLSGGTLAQRIARGRLSIGETFELGAVLLDAAECIHRAGILHRDIKPSNIGFTADGVPKLLDFGLARMMDTALGELVRPPVGAAPAEAEASSTALEGATTAAGSVLGTPEYMSPEAVVGERPDPSFDLWSIAVVLYEAFSGRPPFAGVTAQETLDLVRGAHAPDLQEVVAGCPAAVADFFRDALALERARRPSSAGAMKRRVLELRAAQLAGAELRG